MQQKFVKGYTWRRTKLAIYADLITLMCLQCENSITKDPICLLTKQLILVSFIISFDV